MSMLADKKTKPSWVLNPRQSDWSKDQNKLGQKMLEKMGWSAGKGLGAKEQGPVEAIRVPYKGDSRGLGAARDKEQAIWLQQQQSFSSLLQDLNGDDRQSVKVTSLEEKSKTAKKRVHYHKFTRGKDISRYSKKDLSCIVGPVNHSFKAITSTNDIEPAHTGTSPSDGSKEEMGEPIRLEVDPIDDEGTHDEEVAPKSRKRSRKKSLAEVDHGSEETVSCSSEKNSPDGELKTRKSKDKKNRDTELSKQDQGKKRVEIDEIEKADDQSVNSSVKKRTKRKCTLTEDQMKPEVAKKKEKNAIPKPSKDTDKKIASSKVEKIKNAKKSRKATTPTCETEKEHGTKTNKSRKENSGKNEKSKMQKKVMSSSSKTPPQSDDDGKSLFDSALAYLKRNSLDGKKIKVAERFIENHILTLDDETDEDEERTGISKKKTKV